MANVHPATTPPSFAVPNLVVVPGPRVPGDLALSRAFHAPLVCVWDRPPADWNTARLRKATELGGGDAAWVLNPVWGRPLSEGSLEEFLRAVAARPFLWLESA